MKGKLWILLPGEIDDGEVAVWEVGSLDNCKLGTLLLGNWCPGKLRKFLTSYNLPASAVRPEHNVHALERDAHLEL